MLASKGSATAIKRKKVPSQKFLPAYHEAYPCLIRSSSRKGSELVLCTICKSDFHGEVQKNCTRSRALAARVVWIRGGGGVTQGRGGLHIAFGDWHTDLYNCILILSQAVGFEFSHIHKCTAQQET